MKEIKKETFEQEKQRGKKGNDKKAKKKIYEKETKKEINEAKQEENSLDRKQVKVKCRKQVEYKQKQEDRMIATKKNKKK